MKHFSVLLLVVNLVLLVFTIIDVSPTSAAIIWDVSATFDNVKKLTEPFYPPTEQYKELGIAIPRSLNLRAFDEKQNVLLTRNIKIAKRNPDYVEVNGVFANYDEFNLSDSNLAYDWDAEYDTLPELSTGVTVNSHFIAFYTIAEVGSRGYIVATITFDTPIIGFIDTRDSDLTNDLFALTNYVSPASQTLEGLQWKADTPFSGSDYLETRDYIKVRGENNNVLELRWTSWGYEGLRVLTQAPTIP